MTDAIITGLVAIVTCLISNFFQNQKIQALLEYKIDELAKRVDKHNNVIDRTYKLEEIIAIHSEKIKVANNRISDLEETKG